MVSNGHSGIPVEAIEHALMQRAMHDPKLALEVLARIKPDTWAGDPRHDPGMAYRIIPMMPTEPQKRIRKSASKRIALHCGRQSGKTALASIYLIDCLNEGKLGLYLAPIASQADACWRYVTESISRSNIPSGSLKVTNHTKTVTWTEESGRGDFAEGEIHMMTSYNPDIVRSRRVDLLIIDEFQLQSADLWGRTVQPLLAGGGDVVVCMTPPTLASRTRLSARNATYAREQWRKWKASPNWDTFTMSSLSNGFNDGETMAQWKEEMTAVVYEQEVLGSDLEVNPGALWNPDIIQHVDSAPETLNMVTVGVDPSGSVNSERGIIVTGYNSELDEYYVLADLTIPGASPERYARAVIDGYHDYKADIVVAEGNFGGDQVAAVIRAVDESVPVALVNASRGKAVRAQPVAALYEQGKVKHVGKFEDLENQLCIWEPIDTWSPDRLDALVWAITELKEGTVVGGGVYLPSP